MSESPSISESTTPGPRQSHRSIWVIFLILAGVYILFSMPKASAIKWITDLDQGRKQASDKNQFALVMFDASWCENCKTMGQQVLSRPKVRELLKNWVPIEIDIDRQPGIKQAYMVEALPTFIIFSPKGRELKRFTGVTPAEDFIKIIQSVKKENQ